ncbi:MAG TPA: hypothetical protein VH062_18155 [Polyangiaceae bacterium]|jgi:hypothetical protein|nr:hypothetical protein [Polyangiaceae bacterium]
MVRTPLEPVEAENIAADLRARHGLGQKYRISVEASRHGWHVRDSKGRVDSVPPMPAESWRRYLDERFVEAITEHDETSEA